MGQLAWYMQGGGRALYIEYYQQMLKADVMPFLYAPDGPECFGWFKKPITSVAEFTKLRFRISQGLHQAIDIADVVINMAKWKALSPDLQAIVEIALTTSLFEAILYFQHENA